jgi:hypothetical protein
MNTEGIENRAHSALKYLTDTDELAADLKHDTERAEAAHEATVNTAFLHYEGPVETRKARARNCEAAIAAYDKFLIAQREYDAVANKRKSEALAVDWCRSLYSNYRQGK